MPSLTPIERAARTVNTMLDKDANYRDLETYLVPGISGEYEVAVGPAWTPFEEIKRYQISERILEQINRAQMSTSMGLFAEINHAWVTIDNQLYLWDYTNPNAEPVGFEEHPNPIFSVKLVKPRAKVFIDEVSYLLVVATSTDIFLLAVQCERGPEGVHSVVLYRTDLSVSIKGMIVSAIVGSDKTGRIFFADGRDSEDVYELNYQQEERWFHNKCSKTNHVSQSLPFSVLAPFYPSSKAVHVKQMEIDDTRNVLYTLSSNGTIRVFHLKTPTTLDLVITQTLPRTMALCTHIVPQRSEALGGAKMEIIGIDTVSASEANSVSLIATTSAGCRIFMSTTSGVNYGTDFTAAPTSMLVRHIRFPPDDSGTTNLASSQQMSPYLTSTPIGFNSKELTPTARTRRYAPGSTFFFIETQRDDHTLFLAAPHLGQLTSRQDQTQNPRFTEDAQKLELGGGVQDVGLVTEPFAASNRPLGFGNELAVQFDKPLCEFAVMTHTGILTLRRRRLVDIFAAIIQSRGGPAGLEAELRKLVQQYGRAETVSTAVAVACGQGSNVGQDLRVAQISDPDVLEYARKAFVELGGKAQLNENATVEGLNVDNVQASPRHDGIAIYISRLVRSIWRSPIVRETTTPAGAAILPAQKVSKLRDVQRALIALQEFLEANRQNIDGLAGPEALGRATSRQDEVELQGENRALTSLLQLINNIIEGIAFVLVLFDEKLEEILALLPPDLRPKVLQLTFEALFSLQEGRNLARALVKAIVSRNIAKGSNVETVAEALRRKCGSFCSSADVVIFKAQESLQKATEAGANAERGRILLNDSLRLFEQVARSLTQEHLTQAVEKYVAVEFYAGAIRLALKVAQELDRGNKALSWLKDGRPTPDARESAYDTRAFCYDLVFRVIEAVDQAQTNQSGVAQDGVISSIARRRQEAYDEINGSDDEVFLNYLYEWYISKGWADRLLEIESPFVVDYLRRSSASEAAHADLLWRYHAHYHDFLGAAQVQYDLAKSDFNLTLEQRIEYLSRAKANASTRMTGFTDTSVRNRQSRQELIKGINDYLDIANIQDDILQKLKGEPRLTREKRQEVISILDGNMLSLNELYNNFADNAGYYDICLLIYHAADYRSLPDIRSTWTNLIEQTHKDALAQNHQAPWELVANSVETIGRRVALNDNVFPVNVLLQILLQYDLNYYNHETNPARAHPDLLPCSNLTWPLDVFIRVGASFEILIATIEALWYAQDHPFTGRNRKYLAKWLIYTVEEWGQASHRLGGALYGGEENAIGLADCLRVVIGANELPRDTADDRSWVERGRAVREAVEAAAR